MPTSFVEPFLMVDLEKMYQMDTRRVETLFSMWSVFNRCADSVDQGRRYENLTWRLWNRETFCAEPRARFTHPPTRLDGTPRQSTRDLPQLSSSVDSLSSDEYECVSAESRASPVTITGSRNASDEQLHMHHKAKPAPPVTLERMVQSIQNTKVYRRGDMTGLAPSVAAAVRPVPSSDPTQKPDSPHDVEAPPKASVPRASHSSASTVPLSSPESAITRSNTCGSETSAEFISAPDVVRGFTPSSISHHRASCTSAQASPRPDPVPIKSSLRQRADPEAVKQAKFVLGGSSEDESSSLEDQVARRRLGGPVAPAVKQASFSDRVETRFVSASADDEAAIASDDEDDEVDESAIEEDEDDDEEEWDDYSDAEDVPTAPQFGRIDSTSRLPTRRSLLTSGLHQSEREHQMLGLATHHAAGGSGLRRSRASSPNGPSLAASVEDDEPMAMQGIKITRTKPPASQHQPALSPRTTRRNMLATELTESLRRHLLWERQQKATTATAYLKRRHTSQDVANLQKYPEQAEAASKGNSWNEAVEGSVFDTGLGEYHSRGW